MPSKHPMEPPRSHHPLGESTYRYKEEARDINIMSSEFICSSEVCI
jgi:hypothetical protein